MANMDRENKITWKQQWLMSLFSTAQQWLIL